MRNRIRLRSALALLGCARAAVFAGIAAVPAFAHAQLCPERTHTLAFFNGVWNTPDEAYSGARTLLATLREGMASDPRGAGLAVGAEVFYNASGLERRALDGIEDLAEVFEQRAAELDEALSQRWELFWEVVDGRLAWWRKIAQAVPRANELADALVQARNARILARTARLAAAPPTGADYAAHRLRLQALSMQGHGLLMVGHSQGNFFLNTAWRAADAAHAAAVHLAPAASVVNGPHLLSSNDTVIAALRGMVPGLPPPANLAIPFSADDVTGHMLVETYLDARRNGRAAAGAMMAQALLQLARPAPSASPGFFTATLAWDGEGDLDLHVLEPGGAHVHYGARIGAAGALDLDNIKGHGPEHYHASCDPARLQAGTYSIGLNNYAAPAGRTATLQLATAEHGVLRTVRLDAGAARGPAGDEAPQIAMRAAVARQPDGSWTVRAH
ncbi:hypothetical protein PIGHUM_00818 [Pigmentiphaga humi]|uniref:Uncharacterized protein n=1 Tax=Pigmentiphaga humi TaxID=2478468 RepID=A0A3P4AZ50_9BURK|nr:hypothetical protein [Pigmentiphaga humi]VCU68760.1 hypothetical protein PIGHUM_00818 [Pigmentiphaga humi]